ncbi:hypothetical protein F383_12460 [Gossypium arboreum]|uniref:Uncharacterized protein n=1 Tax=Gossypium arboreum TaxID=29729 RepID=A0A0B0PXL9_GOSAR|nr:hypothetical protein F383_12460 [Gossypium arboreum]
MSLGDYYDYVIQVLVLYILPVAEYTGMCCGYLTTCVSSTVLLCLDP